MMELNKILSDGIWGTICSYLNANFEKIRIELMKLSHSSIYKYNKGYFSSEMKLLNRWPKPEIGWYAFVGSPWPGKVYECTATGTWTNTNTSPAVGDDVFVQMLKYYIDNDTIYWDEAKKVIRARGGGGGPAEETFTIAVGINPGDIGKCDVDATGDYLSVVPAANGSSYTVTAKKGGTVTVNILPATGYAVSKLNVDQSPQGNSSSYTFKKIAANHTMYVWMEVAAEEIPTDFLIRSDKPDTLYSSTHVALNAIKADYPGGLTQDVTITCIKTTKERRLIFDENKQMNERIFLAVLKHWNQRSMYTLTIDGADKLTYDCASLGGFKLQSVDNVVFRNIGFINFANYIDGSTPDEIAAIMFIGSATSYVRNLAIWDCSFNGISTTNKTTCSTYTISTKYTENVCFQGSEFNNNAGMTFKMSNSHTSSFVRNHISGVFNSGTVAHAGFLDVSNGYQLVFEDNNLDGKTFRESSMYISGVDNVFLRRNTIRGGGRVGEFSSNTKIKNLVIESNLMVGCVVNPIFTWIADYFSSSSDIDNFIFRNNTLWMNGGNWQQFAVRFTQADVRVSRIYNNIMVDTDASLTSGGTRMFLFKTLGALDMGYNLFKMGVADPDKGNTYATIVEVANPDSSADSITISGGNSRSLNYLRSAGYDKNSSLIFKNLQLLDIEAGGDSYAITPDYDNDYPANNDYVPEMDCEYKKSSAARNSRGCYNLSGSQIDESVDTTTGYIGLDVSEKKEFSNQAVYSVKADSVLLLTHNTLDRKRLVRWAIEGMQHKTLALGKYALMHADTTVDDNNEYLADELYNITID